MPALSVEALVCRRGGRTVVAGVGFSLDVGEVLVVSGRNGSGKSTLLRSIALLAPLAGGRIVWQGQDTARDRDAWRRTIGWLGHADAVKPDLTVREMLLFGVRLRAAARDADAAAELRRCEQAAVRFDLEALLDSPGRYLSAGQRRRVAIARLVAGAAPLWLMDEPTVSLDGPSSASLEAAIAAHQAAGGMAIIATHTELDLASVSRLDLDRLPPPPQDLPALLEEIAAQ